MDGLFALETPVGYLWSGKFTTPSAEWMHITRPIFEYELFFITEGVLYIASEEKQYVVQKNEYLLMPPTPKQYGYAPSQCSFYWLHFSIDSNGITESGANTIPQQAQVPNRDRIIILINQLHDVARRYQHRYTIDLLATGILLELYNQLQHDTKKRSFSSKTKIYESILHYLAWNRYQRNTLREIAQYLGYHEKYLAALFKEQAGISFKRYVLQELMEYAKVAIIDPKKTIAQIALSIGYSDAHNFSHAFKHIVGISPKEYRNSYIGAADNPPPKDINAKSGT